MSNRSDTRTRRLDRAGALAGFALAAIVLAPALVGRSAFVPADYWLGAVPFALAAPPEARRFDSNTLLGDPAILYPPQLFVLRKALAASEVALWNRWARAGEAMLGSGQAGPFAPTTWPILVAPWPEGFAWAALLRFGLLWLGAYRFGRALALGTGGAVALAAGFCTAPLFAVHFQQLPRATAHVALPWLLLAVERLAAGASRCDAAAVRAALPLAPWAAFAIAAGYPPAAFTVLLGAALYAAVRLPWRPLRHALVSRALVAAALAIGVVAAFPILGPFAAALTESATLADRGDGGQWVLPAHALRLLFDPFAFGSPFSRTRSPWTGPDNFEEAQLYGGLVPLVLLVAALPALRRLVPADRLRIAGLSALVFVAAVLAFGVWPLHAWLTAIPPFSVNANPRLLFLAHTGLAGVALLAATRLPTAQRSQPVVVVAALVASGLGAALLAALGAPEPSASRPWIALSAAGAVAVALRAATTTRERAFAAGMITVVWLADAGIPYARLHPQVPRDWADPARAVGALPDPLRAEIEAARVPRVAFERVTPPNLPALFGVEDVRAYSFPSPLRYDRYAIDVMRVQMPLTLVADDLAQPSTIAGLERTCARWLLTTLPEDTASLAPRVERVWQRAGRLFLHRLRDASPCAAWYPVDAVNGAADLDEAVAALADSLSREPEEIVVEAGASQRSARPADPIATMLAWRGANAIEVEVPSAARTGDGWLVLRVSHDRGWSATSDAGEPLRVVPAQVRFLAVETPAGTERVRLRYRPIGWPGAWAASALAMAAFALTAFLARRRV